MKAGWPTAKIGQVCSLMTGGTPSRSNSDYFGGDIKWLVSGDIHQSEIFDCEGRITDLGLMNSNARILPVNSVIIALNGQGKTRGTVALLRTSAACNQSLVSITPNDPNQLLPEFLYANLHGRYQEIRRMTGDKGNERRGLNMPLIRSIEIPIPPLNDQKRIVAILNKGLSGITAARAAAEKNRQNVRTLFESVLNSVDGKTAALGDYVTIKTGKLDANAAVEGGIYPFFTCAREIYAIDNFAFDCEAILLAGNNAVGDFNVKHYSGKFNAYQRTYVITINNEDQLLYRFLYFQMLKSLKRFKERSVGAGTKFLKLGMIKDLEIALPSLEEQRRLVSTLDAVLAETQNLEALYQRKLEALDELKQSLLHQAFSGQL
ncbi:restriction endonuclease subunit S [Stutzerimonas frequens]|uniref:restriction endonuclease subunit S n=1 Tax=Stutzerimonas frequens TaxID=2968969 RepID=UPI0022DDCEA0|nr:restriction endonuclease subunit S [Stutzerimonas frequens]MBU1303869.1 restriction endonuclease subunit S [Gammaproteobacteria bacterium]MBU2374316.1 restriction endonuclease subunit S [Gammaproteobacteria bacterium]MDA0424491.1 restriction endonuclease subunit S [Stutzerimonas frequens]